LGGSKISEIQQEKIELKINYAKVILLTPFYLCLKFVYNFFLCFLGLANNLSILIKGKRSDKLTQRILNFAQLDFLLGRIILFQTNQYFSNRTTIINEELSEIISENTTNRRRIVLERLGGFILFFQTKIIYKIFLLINWITFLLVKLFKKTSNSVDKFISNSLEEIHQTNLYLTGIKDQRVRWNSLDDPIAGTFYPLLTHGFLFGYFLLYAFLAILKLADNPLDLIANSNYFTQGEKAHAIIIALFLYLLFFLFLIPYYIHYPDRIKDKKLVRIWKEIGFTIRYPLRDLFILVFYVASFLVLFYNAIGEIVNTGTLFFDPSGITAWIVVGFFWAIAEEITFRGYLIMGLQRKTNSLITIIVSSVLFGLYHSLQGFIHYGIWDAMLNAFLFGIFLAILRIKSKSFFIPFVIHLFDYIFFKDTFKIYQELIPLYWNRYYYVLLLIIMTLTTILILLIYPRKAKKKNEIES